MNIVDLPNGVLIEIFEYLSYEDCSKNRLICRRFDQICQLVLNCGFNRVIKKHSLSLKKIKSLLPRRESERRNHPLARHVDILESIETRISMLSMTYNKYIELNLCCFIPGRVLDEIFRILRLISKTYRPLRPHEVLQELRDISSMAVEHFDEKIANSLKQQAEKSTECTDSASSRSAWIPTSPVLPPASCICSPTICCATIRQRVSSLINFGNAGFIDTLIEQDAANASLVEATFPFTERPICPGSRAALASLKKYKRLYRNGIRKVNIMEKAAIRQSRVLAKTYKAISQLSTQVVELKKRIEDVEVKHVEIFANMKQKQIEDASVVNCPQPKIEVSNEVVGTKVIESTKPITNEIISSSTKKRRYEDISINGSPSSAEVDKPFFEIWKVTQFK